MQRSLFVNENRKKYWPEYKWSNVNAMIQNMKRKPLTNP